MNTKAFDFKNAFPWLLLLLIAGLFALKYEALFLPYFWDEAWVYMPAIRTMAEKGPSLMPGTIDAELYTGHPTMFYFLASSWIKLWGYSMPVAHLFPMLISTTLLISAYYVTFKWSQSHFSAFLASLLIAIQPNFLSQSSFLLIEVWLGLLFVWSFYFYSVQNWPAFFLVMVTALWSKESAYCLLPAFGLLFLAEFLGKKTDGRTFGKRVLLMIAIALGGFTFFALQKLKMGWFLFPRHANWVNAAEFKYKFDIAIGSVFVSDARSYIFIAAIVFYILARVFQQVKLSSTQATLILGAYLFALIFMVFASFNFFSSRYLLGAMPMLMISNAMLIGSFEFKYRKVAMPLLIFLFGLNNIHNSFNYKSYSDIDLNYIHLVKAEVAMVKYLEENRPNGKMYAPFLMNCNLREPYSGMVDKPFDNLAGNVHDEGIRYYLIAPNEDDPDYEKIKIEKKLKLIHKTTCERAWVELYEVGTE